MSNRYNSNNNRDSRRNRQGWGRGNQNSNSNRNDQRNSNRNPQRFEDAPITYKRLRTEQKEVTIRVPSNTTEKENRYVPLYNGTINKESYLLMMNEFFVLIKSHHPMTDPAKINSTINSFRN